MAKANGKPKLENLVADGILKTTHEGAIAERTSYYNQLRRSVMACLLWEDSFYESGVQISERIEKLCKLVKPQEILDLAIYAKKIAKLRSIPLFLIAQAAKRSKEFVYPKNSISPLRAATEAVITRADDPGELIAMCLKDGDKRKSGDKLAVAVRRGIADAMRKFDAYKLGKYNRGVAVKLKDVIRITHPTGKDKAQSDCFKAILDDTLKSPDTWEVALSTGADKKETFTRLLKNGDLGYLALLRNLRNMEESGVDRSLVSRAILDRKGAYRMLPFQFISAANHAPGYYKELNESLIDSVKQLEPLDGTTYVLVDVSGSMSDPVANKSKISRAEAAAGIAACINGDTRVFVFDTGTKEVPNISGLPLVNHITSKVGGGTNIRQAVDYVLKYNPDRLIIITDEQTNSILRSNNISRKYIINVACYENGVGEDQGYIKISGFSENTIKYIHDLELLAKSNR